MPTEAPSHTCTHPDCYSRQSAATEAPSGAAARTHPERLERAVWWHSLKRHLLWFLAFFGIYASSSVCVF
jgi:hypothetical protein